MVLADSPERVNTPERRAGSVRSVERALDLLIALERAGEPMGLSQLARAVGIPKPTAQRLLSVLERRGFVQKERAAYQLGAGIVPLAGAFLASNSLAKAALPVLEQMALISGETVSLQVRNGFDRVVVQRVRSPHALGYSLNIGQRIPLHLGASGQVLMAGMPEDELTRFLEPLSEMRLASGQTLTRADLLAKLREVRACGFAISYGEREVYVVSLAAPVVKPGKGVVAALAVTGPPGRMPQEKIEQLSFEVRRAAQEVARLSSRV